MRWCDLLIADIITQAYEKLNGFFTDCILNFKYFFCKLWL